MLFRMLNYFVAYAVTHDDTGHYDPRYELGLATGVGSNQPFRGTQYTIGPASRPGPSYTVGQHAKASSQTAPLTFEQIDRNGDGVINKREWERAMKAKPLALRWGTSMLLVASFDSPACVLSGNQAP